MRTRLRPSCRDRIRRACVERLGLPVYAPRPDSAQDLIDKFGITAEQAGDGSPDLVWLRSEAPEHWRPYTVDGPLPSGIEAFEGREPNDIVLWVESHRAVVAGDTVADFGDGLEVSARWLRDGGTRESRTERLRPLLEKPVEHVLATHGGPFDRAALERALSSSLIGVHAVYLHGYLHGPRRSELRRRHARLEQERASGAGPLARVRDSSPRGRRRWQRYCALCVCSFAAWRSASSRCES